MKRKYVSGEQILSVFIPTEPEKPPVRQNLNYFWLQGWDIWKGEEYTFWGIEVETPLWFWEEEAWHNHSSKPS